MPGYLGYQLTENLNGSISIQYTPTTPGVHKIEVNCNGAQVEGMPLWCVVQRADYGYITSYGPRLLDILGQAGFAETVDQEGLVITQDGDTLSVMKKDAAALAGTILDVTTEITEADQCTTDAIENVLEGMPGITGAARHRDTNIKQYASQTHDTEESVAILVKAEPGTADDQTIISAYEHHAAEKSHGDDGDDSAVGEPGILAPSGDDAAFILDDTEGIFVQSELEEENIPEDIQGIISQVELKQEKIADDGAETEPKKDLPKDKFPCQYEGCPKSYGKEIYAKNCLQDHLIRARRKSKRLSKLPGSLKPETDKDGESRSTRGRKCLDTPSIQSDDKRDSTPSPVSTRSRKRGPKSHSDKDDDYKANPRSTVDIKYKVSTSSKSDQEVSQQEDKTPARRRGRPRKTPIRVPDSEEPGDDKPEFARESRSTASPTSIKRARTSSSPEAVLLKRSRRTPKPTWKMLESPIMIKKEQVDDEFDLALDRKTKQEVKPVVDKGRGKEKAAIRGKGKDSASVKMNKPNSENMDLDDSVSSSDSTEVTCPYEGCGHLFTSASKLKMHKHAIHGFECPREGCSRLFKSSSACRKHLRRFHDGENLDKHRSLKQKVKLELDADESQGDNQENEGSQSFDSVLRLRQRKLNDEKNFPFKCKRLECNRRFISASARAKHIRRVHLGENLDKYRVWKRTPRDKMRSGRIAGPKVQTVTGEELFQCIFDEDCGRYFKSSSARAKHIRRFHEGKNIDRDRGNYYDENGMYTGVVYKCKFVACGRIYSNGSNLRKHIRINEHYMDGESDEDGVRPDEESEDDEDTPESSQDGQDLAVKKELSEQELVVCHREGCGKIFKKLPQLNRHIESHNKFPYQCNKGDCKKMFRFEESLSLHKFSYHGMKDELKRFECELCNKHFSSWCLLKKHQRVHTLETPYQCQDCLQRFKWQTSLLTHACLNKSGEGATLKCPECNKIFNMKCLLKKHMVMHSEARPHRCEQCEKSFKMRETLQKHMRKAHTSEMEKRIYAEKRGWVCPDCDRVCLSYRDYDRHRTKHSDFRPYICDQCANQFKTPECLTAHIKQMHAVTLIQKEDGTVEEVRTLNYFACDFPDCDKKFRRHHMYLEHKKIHYSQERLPCDHEGCKKSYPTIFKLKEHQRSVHRERPPVFCDVCGKQMKNTSALANHMKIHTQLSRIACDFPGCDKTFTAKTTLDRHILMKHQAPEKLFECNIEDCKKKFKLKCLLDQHLQSHTTERNYRCEVCNSCFKTYNTMRSHMKTHDKSNHHQCTLCGKQFSRKTRYLQHLATQHQGEVHIIAPGDPIPFEGIQQIEQIDEKGEHIQFFKPEIIQAINEATSAEPGTYTSVAQVIADSAHIVTEGTHILAEGSHIFERAHIFSDGSHVVAGGTHVTADGQTHILTDVQPQVLTDGQTHILTDGQTHVLTDGEAHIMADGRTHIIADGSQIIADGSQIIADGSQIIADGSQIIADGSQIIADGSHIIADGTQIMADGSHIMADEQTQVVDGAHVMPNTSHLVTEATHVLSDGTHIVADGTHVLIDGTHIVEESTLIVDDTKPELVYQEVVAEEKTELVYQEVIAEEKTELVYQEVVAEEKTELVYQEVVAEEKTELVYQEVAAEEKTELVYQEVAAEEKTELVYEDTIILPQSQLMEFNTNYQ